MASATMYCRPAIATAVTSWTPPSSSLKHNSGLPLKGHYCLAPTSAYGAAHLRADCDSPLASYGKAPCLPCPVSATFGAQPAWCPAAGEAPAWDTQPPELRVASDLRWYGYVTPETLQLLRRAARKQPVDLRVHLTRAQLAAQALCSAAVECGQHAAAAARERERRRAAAAALRDAAQREAAAFEQAAAAARAATERNAVPAEPAVRSSSPAASNAAAAVQRSPACNAPPGPSEAAAPLLGPLVRRSSVTQPLPQASAPAPFAARRAALWADESGDDGDLPSVPAAWLQEQTAVHLEAAAAAASPALPFEARRAALWADEDECGDESPSVPAEWMQEDSTAPHVESAAASPALQFAASRAARWADEDECDDESPSVPAEWMQEGYTYANIEPAAAAATHAMMVAGRPPLWRAPSRQMQLHQSSSGDCHLQLQALMARW